MMKLVVSALTTLLFVNGQTADYNYDNQGTTWATTAENGWFCLADAGSTKQSPYHFIEADQPTAVDENAGLAIYSHENEAEFTVAQVLNNFISVTPTSPKDTVTYNSTTYTLERYIVRGGSEHALGGTTAVPDYSELEIQSFFKNGNKQLILSLLVDNGGTADLAFVDYLAVDTSLNATVATSFKSTDAQLDFLGQGMTAFRALSTANFFKYEGSLTYPPCTEGVIWLVGSAPIKVPNTNLNALKNKVKYNDTNYTPVDGVPATEEDVHGNWRDFPDTPNKQTELQAGITRFLIKASEYTYSTGDALFAVPATSVLLVTLAALVSTVG